MPELIRPMLAVPGELPSAARDAAYGYELKWDGVRAMTYAAAGRLRVLSRNDKDISVSYPELAEVIGALDGRQVVLDGEIVAFDAHGRPSFGRLQSRMHVGDETQARRLATSTPTTYLLFDVLHLDGRDLTSLPYTERRELLDSLDVQATRVSVPPYIPGSGTDTLALSQRQGLEGIVAKQLDSPYEPGRRSRSWLKVKNLRFQEVVIGGWRSGQGYRANTLGSLLLGISGAEGLDYVGRVGTGFTDRMLADLSNLLRPLERETSPFTDTVPAADARDARWVEPQLVGEVAFGDWTLDGRLRHPSWRGLRPDKGPSEVERE